MLLYQFCFSAVFTLLATLLIPEQAIRTIAWWPVFIIILFAILAILGGRFLLYGFQHFDVNVGTVILATELLFATMLGYLFFQEIPTTQEVLGGIIIAFASVISTIDIKRSKTHA